MKEYAEKLEFIDTKKAVQAIVLDCLNTPNDEFSKVLQSEGGEIK